MTPDADIQVYVPHAHDAPASGPAVAICRVCGLRAVDWTHPGSIERTAWCAVCHGLESYAVHRPGYRMARVPWDEPGHPFKAAPMV